VVLRPPLARGLPFSTATNSTDFVFGSRRFLRTLGEATKWQPIGHPGLFSRGGHSSSRRNPSSPVCDLRSGE
jgi:hypothetical protein